jgi:hypothetical protein
MIRRLATAPRRAASALVSALVIVTTLGQPPEGSMPADRTTAPEEGRR